MAWDKEQAGDAPFGVEHHFRIQSHLLELTGYQHDVIPGQLGRPNPELLLERSGLRLEGLPGFVELRFRQRRFHGVVELAYGPGEILFRQQFDKRSARAGDLDRRGLHGQRGCDSDRDRKEG